ncbi:hypothetical protein WK16_09170 [Burkholderia ubonensis]|nr:hypothetical protein WK16_09170 [Burkholderia ubonensis]OJB04902.1 hypothetical protein BGV48_17425 [Burkholderia ubonensis]
MPLIDMVWKWHARIRSNLVCSTQRRYRIIAGLNSPVISLVDACTQVLSQHLCTQTKPEERLAFCQRLSEPVDFFANIRVAVVGTHGAAENNRAIVVPHVLWKRVAKSRSADIELQSELTQEDAYSARRRLLLMQND